MRNSVDLPQPDGPTTVTNSPADTLNDTSSSAVVPSGNVIEIESNDKRTCASVLLLCVGVSCMVIMSPCDNRTCNRIMRYAIVDFVLTTCENSFGCCCGVMLKILFISTGSMRLDVQRVVRRRGVIHRFVMRCLSKSKKTRTEVRVFFMWSG